eukprot:GEMP01017581.1.p1 GENE.GEMP01017581.1~~GEMP01017581.1.p1  ORF type:complete len:447 (+),score=101.03 GEMP01017581.1:54-1394(+)
MAGIVFANRTNVANAGAAAALQFFASTATNEGDAKETTVETDDSLPGLHDDTEDKRSEKGSDKEDKRSASREKKRKRSTSREKRRKRSPSPSEKGEDSEKRDTEKKRKSRSRSRDRRNKSRNRSRNKSRDKSRPRRRSRRRSRHKSRSRRRDRRKRERSRRRSRSRHRSRSRSRDGDRRKRDPSATKGRPERAEKGPPPPPVNNTPVPGGRQIGVRGEWAEFLFPDGSKLFRNILNGQIVTGIPSAIGTGRPAPGTPPIIQTLEPPKTTLFILHVPSIWSESDLAQHFAPFGNLLRSDLPKNLDGTRKGYGFVTYATTDEGQKAIDSMHGFPVQDINGQKTLGVSFRASPGQNGTGGTVASMGGTMAAMGGQAMGSTMNMSVGNGMLGAMGGMGGMSHMGGMPGSMQGTMVSGLGPGPLPGQKPTLANMTLAAMGAAQQLSQGSPP